MPKVATSRFNLKHDVKLSFQMGELVPTCCMEVVPGDKFDISVENMLRFAPLISPVMHKVNVTTHYFFVPNRILWPQWEKWITGDEDLVAPFIQSDTVVEGSLADYLGMPVGLVPDGNLRMSALPFAAYCKIYDEYYRDQNLQTEEFTELIQGSNHASYLQWLENAPLRRAWMHDYFTSALPFAQKGDAVQIPLTSQADIPVVLTDDNNNSQLMRQRDNHPSGFTPGPVEAMLDGATPSVLSVDAGAGAVPGVLDPNGTLTVDVQSDATDINTLRRAFRLQEWLERNARGGTRYIESILSHFGVRSSDSRLQRPEYIGGSRQNMVISEVLATAETTEANVPVGNMAGHGISVGGGNRFSYRAEEHGWIIGIINVQPVTAYQQGLHKSFARFDRLDYAWPSFANIGEQEVTLKELYAFGPVLNQNSVFGYVPRYAEYKFMNSRVAGEMRNSLAFWHLGRIFDEAPALNSEFIECRPSNRIFAVTDDTEDHIFAHIFNNISAVRKLPRYGVPTI